jgi:hypothetical protein
VKSPQRGPLASGTYIDGLLILSRPGQTPSIRLSLLTRGVWATPLAAWGGGGASV